MGTTGLMNKIAGANINLSMLKDDLNRVMTPSLRTFILSQILARELQINLLMRKINIDTVGQAQGTKPLPEKKTPQPKATTVATKKKTVDNLNRELVK